MSKRTSPAFVALPDVREVWIEAIDESPTNPRRRFDEAALAELADSIRTAGVVSPILVRPHPTVRERYELVFGARRLRAARLAGLSAVPAMVRELDDLEVLELQVVENLQRADVTALEEAAGYQQLRDRHGMTVDQIAAKIGKSRRYVYGRLSLAKLTLATREVLEAAACPISDSVALLLTGLPEIDQLAAAKELGEGVEDYDDDADEPTRRPYTVQAAEHLIRTTYTRSLEAPPFDVDDVTLGAPACGGCMFNTANQEGSGARPPRCADRACFERKVTKAGDARIAQARATGIKVLGPTDSVFDGTYLTDRKYVDARSAIYEFGVGGKTGIEVLERLPIDAAPELVLARDGAGMVRELIPRAALKAALEEHGKAAGIVHGAHAGAMKPASHKTPEDKKREQVVALRRERAQTAIRTIKDDCTRLEPREVYAIAARALVRELDAEDKARLCKMLGLHLEKDGSGSQHGPADKALAELFALASSADHWLQITVLLSCASSAVHGLWQAGSYGRSLREVAELLDVELEPVREPGRPAGEEVDWRDEFSPPAPKKRAAPPKKKPGKASAKKPAPAKSPAKKAAAKKPAWNSRGQQLEMGGA